MMYLCSTKKTHMRKSHILTSAWLTAILLLFTSLTGCRHHQTPYPAELLQVDSLIQKGRYGKADTLFSKYVRESDRSQVSESTKMYERLLQMGLKDKKIEPMTDVLEAEQLCDYYKSKGDKQMYARAMFYMATTYYYIGELKQAEDYYFRTLDLAKDAGMAQLQTWVYRKLFSVMFYQEQDDDAYRYAWLLYRNAKENNDTMQIILGASFVAIYYTAKNNADSVIYYYQETIRLAKEFGAANAQSQATDALCDIYLQLERISEAQKLVFNTGRGLANKGLLFMHMQQLDSAAYYYSAFLRQTPMPYDRTEGLKALADISQRQGKPQQEAEYLRQLMQLKDSMYSASQAKEVKLVQARYNYAQIQEKYEKQKERLWLAVGLLLFVVLLLTATVVTTRSHYKMMDQQRKAQQAANRLIAITQQDRQRQSQDQLTVNRQRIEELQQAEQEQPQGVATQLERDELEAENRSIEARQRSLAYHREELERSQLYRQLMARSGQKGFTLTDEQWEELGDMVDRAYGDFTQALFSIHKLSDIELHVCYLLKLGIPLTDVANMLNRSRSAITHLRSRLYEKLTGHPGTATDLDKLLKDL